MALQSIVRWLLPKEDHFYDFLEKQADFTAQAASALSEFKGGRSTAAAVSDAVQKLEHDADSVVRQMEDALAKTFVTPIDREDLQRLSGDLDDVVDMANLAARAAVLYGVERPTPPMEKLIDALTAACAVIKTAVPRLRAHKYAELIEDCRKIRTIEKEGDAVYRAAVSVLFHSDTMDARVLLREREVLNDLENAIDKCDEVAGTLSNLSVKHG